MAESTCIFRSFSVSRTGWQSAACFVQVWESELEQNYDGIIYSKLEGEEGDGGIKFSMVTPLTGVVW